MGAPAGACRDLHERTRESTHERTGVASQKTTVEVDGRTLALSNLTKVLYPRTGFTKGAVIDYYSRIAPVLLPHLADRALTIKRYPNGVDEKFFFEKNAARGTPDWVRTVTLPVPGSTMNRDTIDFVVVEELATLVWLANLAALELHVPQWQLDVTGAPQFPDRVVFDLDPGEGAGLAECVHVALALRERLGALGSRMVPVTSGSKGLHLYVPMDQPITSEQASGWARLAAEELEKALPTYLHRTDTATWPFRQTSDPDRRSGADLNPLGCPSPDSCRIPRAGRGVKGRVAPAERRRRRP